MGFSTKEKKIGGLTIALTTYKAIIGRHQVMKNNYWDHEIGWLNVVAIIQSASDEQKREVFAFLKRYFGENP